MLTTTLLSKYLAKQKTAQEVERVALVSRYTGNTGVASANTNVFVDEDYVEFLPERLTANQAQALRVSLSKTGSVLLPWQILTGQLLIGILFAALAWLITGKSSVAASMAYGVLAVVIPAALFARGLTSQFSSLNALTAGFGFFVWEAVKIVATVVLIAIAPRLVTNLDWLALLISLIVTMKAVFVLLWFLPKAQSKLAKNITALYK